MEENQKENKKEKEQKDIQTYSNWIVKEEQDKQEVENIKNILNKNGYLKNNKLELISNILCLRNIKDEFSITQQIEPKRDMFFDPFQMPDMEIIVDRILKAIENKEKICVYGDYDVDGITSTSIMFNFFKSIGVDIDVYIPNRLYEGYGINKNAIDEIAKRGITLMISVDCGITAIDEIEYAKDKNIEVIITDHHELQEKLPNCVAVCDLKRKDHNYPFSDLAGCGVAFKVISAISKKLGLKEEKYLKYLDIVAIGTIADIVPLKKENILITKLGLKLLPYSKNKGIRKLIEKSEINNITSGTIGYILGPKINASGRLGDSNTAFELLTQEDDLKIDSIVDKLNQYNVKRQDIQNKIYEDAIKIIEEKKLYENKVILVKGEDYHHGIIGIVASKIVEKYFKPVIVFSKDGDVLKGSGRSIKGFNLFEALTDDRLSTRVISFGGHEMAIGINLKENMLEKFQEDLNTIAIERKIDSISKEIEIDMKLDEKHLEINEIENLNILEPFGAQNEKPIFLLEACTITKLTPLSQDKHLKIEIKTKSNDKILDVLCFGRGDLKEFLNIGDTIDVVGNLNVNEFNNKKTLQLLLKDLRIKR